MFLVGWKEVKGPHRNRVRQVENSGKAKAKKDNRKSSLPLVNKKKKGKEKDDGDTKKPKGRFKKVGYAMMWWFQVLPPSSCQCLLLPYAEDETGIGPDVLDTPFKRGLKFSKGRSSIIKTTSHLRATRGTIISARLEPPIYAFLVEHMPTRK